MNSVLVAPAIMVGIGLFFGTILAVAQRFLKVDEDPRIEATNELLPGTNCGACGQPGCLPFAEKLVAGEVTPSQCTVSTGEAIEEIADLLQVDAGNQEKLVARLRCAGGRSQANQIAEYQGFEGCRAAALVSGGGKGCAWGCLGLADRYALSNKAFEHTAVYDRTIADYLAGQARVESCYKTGE